MRPRLKPARDTDYADLVRRHRGDPDFASLVGSIALGLDLVVLDVAEGHGLVIASTEDSAFAVRISEYARRTGGEGRAAERVLHALAHFGAATMAYPRPADLGNPAYVGRKRLGVRHLIRDCQLGADRPAS